MKILNQLALLVAIFTITACSNNENKKETTVEKLSKSNPFYQESTLPFHVPDFNTIKDEDFKPAIEEGMKLQLEEINAIANNTDEPTFENTLVEMEKSGQMLNRVYRVFNLLTGANTNENLQEIQEEQAPKMAAHRDAIYLNGKLFERIAALYENKEELKLDSESKHLLEFYYQKFIIAGAKLSEEKKAALKKLNEEEASLGAQFVNKLLAANKAAAFVVEDKELLAGLSENEISAAAQDGKWVISLQNTTQQPDLQNLTNRESRQHLFENSWNRAERGDENDTREVIERLASLRAQKAEILGFPNYSAWKLQNQMAKDPETVEKFLKNLVPPAVAKAKAEGQDIQSLIDKQGGDFKAKAYDWNFYAEQIRKEKYDLDENEVKQYFEVDKVLEDGVFFAANQLYGLTFKEREDIPVYQEDVRVFEVLEEDGSTIGLFYVDFFKRDNKRGGAWMSNIVGQSKLLGTQPVIYNVCNFNKASEGQKSLLSFSNVITMFHEFGHALHGFFADQKYPSLSGTATPRDFVEYPSQINEHWALNPKVLKNYAVHYETGEPMPQELIEKIKNASTFNQGYALTELLAAAQLDMQWHTISSDDEIEGANQFEKTALENTGLNLELVPPRYRSSYFMHIWNNGYASSYYAYLWTEMLDGDTYSWFEENGGMTRENGQRYREMILSKGNTKDFAELYRDFRGRDAEIQPMLKSRGLVDN